MFFAFAASTIGAVATTGEGMTGATTEIRRRTAAGLAPVQRRAPTVNPASIVEKDTIAPLRVSRVRAFATRTVAAVRGWAAVIAASAALVAVLLQLYTSDSV